MPTWLLIIFIVFAWLPYPIAGVMSVNLKIRQGKAPEDTGFSFLPELLVFPALFFVIAKGADWLHAPQGSYFIAILCITMSAAHVISIFVIFRESRKQSP